MLVAEGEDAIFECVVIGEPKPDLRWYFDDDEMVHNERILVSMICICINCISFNVFLNNHNIFFVKLSYNVIDWRKNRWDRFFENFINDAER